jgi:hypothetical protein
MIETLKLKFGRASGLAPVTVNTSAVTVFVGPNNSGKSKALREIHQYCSSGTKNINDVIIDDIIFSGFSPEAAEEKVRKVNLKPHANQAIQPGHVFVGKRSTRHQVNKDQLLAALQNPNATPHHICGWYLAYNTLILDGQSRIGLVNDQKAGDLQQNLVLAFKCYFVTTTNVKRLEELCMMRLIAIL